NFTQFGGIRPEWGATRFLLGNHHTTRYPDAVAVAERVQREWAELEDVSRRWAGVLEDSSLDDEAVQHLAAQASIIRSPSFFRTADGHFFGFEGVQGASTPMWSGEVGGSCPLNCTHVFAYAQGIADLFPEIERDMRECELDVMQAPEGFIPHRVVSPTHLPQLWDREIGGPGDPALDGMLSTVLKAYREVRKGAGLLWLERYWPRLRLLMDHIAGRWDPKASGMLHGIQPSTHDIDLAGLNPFMGTLWLAGLRAMEEMGALVDRADEVAWCRDRFERGSRAYDEALFNGEYFVQVLEEGDPHQFQWESGCLSDQLIGQWWAHHLGLGYLLPAEHVRTALASVVRHNLRVGFRDFENPYRVFADADDTGLLMCTWPLGGRPTVPTRYCDEVWTGIEQQVAAHCLHEGLLDEANRILSGLWSRHDGRRRNPYNQIECGDHYVRALSGWSVLQAWSGVSFDASTATLHVRPSQHVQSWPLLTDKGWGLVSISGARLESSCRFGQFSIDNVVVGADDPVSTVIRLRTGESHVLALRKDEEQVGPSGGGQS
ncbi:MAG: GH116 family glycosyl hydrolase, partial [Arachnia sp.]